MARILVLSVKVPFTSGGQEALVASLISKLKEHGHQADIFELPWIYKPKESLITLSAWWRSWNIDTSEADLVIATKYPTYLINHPNKVLWLVHQHRPAYDLLGTSYSDIGDDPRDFALRDFIVTADRVSIEECKIRCAISQTVSSRLQHYNDIHSDVLYPPPPLIGKYYCDKEEPYLLHVGRVCKIKRPELAISGLAKSNTPLKLKIVGNAESDSYLNSLRELAHKLGVSKQVEFLGRVSEDTLLELYANCLGVVYCPLDEDYGFVTLEAFASSKPLVTTTDSGGALEFSRHLENSVIASPTADSVGEMISRLFSMSSQQRHDLGLSGHSLLREKNITSQSWDRIVSTLTASLPK